jgi:hypothetical protein
MGYIVSTNKNHLIKPNAIKHNPTVFYMLTDKHLKKNSCLFLEGYLRKGKHSISEKNIWTLVKDWPLPERYSGSYAFTVVSEDNIILANDCIGIYPLYYYLKNDEFTASNSLLYLQKALGLEIDEVGKAERLFAPENSEIGSRTLLKGVKRLLPGEKITFDLRTKKIQRSYDNRLYANMHDHIDKDEIQAYWQVLQNEIRFIESLNATRTDIALSGGIDSRILIGAMTPNPDAVAYHYGKPEYYETKIAKRIAKLCRFQFKSRMDYTDQFPEKISLEHTIQNVGPPYSMHWYNIFEMAEEDKTNLILGDMCEALHGRNIKAFSTRQSRIRNYVKHYVLNKDYVFTPASKENFKEWKQQKLKSCWHYIYEESLLKKTDFDINEFKDQIDQDIQEIFNRIENHQLPYAELYEELFTWFTHSRVPMGRQITHCNEKFYTYAPAMSSGMMIASSNIHPNLRLNYRFNNKLFKQIESLKPLNKIPVSQVPYLSRKTPDFMQFLVWGVRSQTDQFLINRMMKHKNPDLRYRLFKSHNWVKVYQSKDLENNLNSYFKNNQLSEDVINACKDLAFKRKNLEEWPLSNTDIMSICVLNLEIFKLTKV